MSVGFLRSVGQWRVLGGVRKIFRLLLVAALISTSLFPLTALAFDTSATNFRNGQYYNQLIPDGDYIARTSMSPADIQSFLASKGSYLASAPPSVLGEGNLGRSAAQIIYDAAQGMYDAAGTLNGITINTSTGTVSPRVILSTLQKEQSLVTNPSPSQRDLDCAMGYEGGNGCTWMFENKPHWAGFTNQVEWAAWQQRYNYERAQGHGFSDYQVGQTVSFADGTGIYSVTFTNRATAALYRYTPYVFNGNYNFWRNIVDWFGIVGNPGGGGSNSNDTATVTVATYRSSFPISGSKQSDVRAYFEGTLMADTGSTSWSTTFSPTIGVRNYTVEYRNTDGGVVATKLITVDRRKVGDVNGDGKVDLLDVSNMSNAWGQVVKDDASINLNPEADNVVDLLDISLLANSFEG
ncbi:MAG: hypothetical protein WEC83_02030 [Patescibacteria group bacterium]